jgi:putative membrane protein
MATGDEAVPAGLLALRGGIGGTLLGLANLVPGISGGTMLLAAGVYPRFIQAVAELTTFKLRRSSIIVLASVVGTACLAIVTLAGPVKDLVVDHRWMAYSVFIGLTLGGAPTVWRLIPDRAASVFTAATAGFAAMVALAWWQSGPAGGQEPSTGIAMMLLAGVVGSSAMILPGISGGYLLLLLGVYVTILSSISQVKDALVAGDLGALIEPLLHVVLPIGIGVVVGVALISNALKWLLNRYERATLGFLLGLLLGAVVGLWPFQQGVAPEPGTTFKGQVVTELSLAEIDPEDYPTRLFRPSPSQVLTSLGLIVAGFLTTLGVARVGGSSS